MSHYKRIAIKVGSNVLTRDDGALNITRISSLVDQIRELYGKGISVILISSGAVASGRSEIKPDRKLDEVSSRQLFSAIGQVKLINRYYEFFREHNIPCGQVLTTKENFVRRRNYLNQKRCMEVMLDNGVIPVVNENDTVSITELMFTDNDELAGLISVMMDVDLLIILSNVDGIYDGNPSSGSSKVIREIKKENKSLSTYIQESKSQFGRGGMVTKCKIAQQVADKGIAVVIANGLRDNILIDIMKDDGKIVCTRFIPVEKSAGNDAK
jgi:glutamate 5-kinase